MGEVCCVPEISNAHIQRQVGDVSQPLAIHQHS